MLRARRRMFGAHDGTEAEVSRAELLQLRRVHVGIWFEPADFSVSLMPG
jgi:hypothetical protein